MRCFARPKGHPPQLLHRPQYPLPHRTALQVALIEHGVGPHSGMDRRVMAVAFHEDLRGSVDVEVRDHHQNLEPRYFIGLSTEFTPTELDCLHLAIFGIAASDLSHLNAMPLAPN